MEEKGNNIEKLRDKLNKTANLKNLSDQEIIALSAELDAEIINYYKEQKKAATKNSCQYNLC